MSLVSEKKFITEEEKNTLKEIQLKTQSLVIELGEIELVKLQLNKRYDIAKTFLDDLIKEEENFNQSIANKYGKTTINPETGEITALG
jgi:hypothetical protein